MSLNSTYDKLSKGLVLDLKKLSLFDQGDFSEGIGFSHLCLQLKTQSSRELKVEFTLKTEDSKQKRFVFSPIFKETADTFFHVKRPLELADNVWTNAVFNLGGLARQHCSSLFHGLGALCISGGFKLRKVFFLGHSNSFLQNGQLSEESVLPPSFSFPLDVIHQNLMVNDERAVPKRDQKTTDTSFKSVFQSSASSRAVSNAKSLQTPVQQRKHPSLARQAETLPEIRVSKKVDESVFKSQNSKNGLVSLCKLISHAKDDVEEIDKAGGSIGEG